MLTIKRLDLAEARILIEGLHGGRGQESHP